MDDLRHELAAGRHEAFARLYGALGDRLHHWLTATLGSRDDADDVLQETFVRLARHHGKLAEVENLTAYVFRMARNEALRFSERNSRRRAHETSLSAEDLFVATPDDVERNEARQLLAEALVRLSPEGREVVELKTFAGLTFAEIAEVTDLPQGTVASRYRAAIDRLRVLLREELP